MKYVTSARVALCAFASLLALSSSAAASPWLVEPGSAVFTGRFDFQSADTEFLDDPTAPQQFPLNGNYIATTFETSGRIGIAPGMELALAIPLKQVTYTADPVILLPTEDPDGFDYYQENIIDLSQARTGVGDIRIAGRFEIIRSSFASSFEFGLKTPTGYREPAGTFGRQPGSQEEFLENAGEFVRPQNVSDDVTLGDGIPELSGKLLNGLVLPTRTFVRLDAGYVLRLSGGGDHLVGDFRVGQAIGDRVLLTAGAGGVYTVQDGEVIGVSVAAADPTLDAADYGGLDNLVLREVTLDYDRLSVGGGVIVRLLGPVEATLSYERIVWGRNIIAANSVSLGFGVRLDAEQ